MTKAAELAKMGEVLTNSQIGGRRNIIINGAMQVAQRGTSATGKGNNDEGYDTVDRFRLDFAGSTAGRLTMTQETITDLPGFANAIKLACTTADTSIASDEMGRLSTRFEGQDLQQFKKGTSEAESITISFYVKGNANATYALDLFDDDNTRQASQLFSVTSSWTRVVKTFAPDTTGAFDDDNARSLDVGIFLEAFRAMLYREMDLHHPFHDVTDKMMYVEKHKGRKYSVVNYSGTKVVKVPEGKPDNVIEFESEIDFNDTN